jgi:hypothetical protein
MLKRRAVLSYIISPNTCHRFVGHLEEEAIHTYTNCIAEIEAGYLPEWYARLLSSPTCFS